MISQLAVPSVCVIDNEREDYEPILDALLQLGLGCMHIRGDAASPLPPEPFRGLRVVFADLHLNAQMGIGAASHAANVFRRVVSPLAGPLLVVIWSKYASDIVAVAELPPDDQPTEADLFKREILEAEPLFRERLIFVEMPKLKAPDRPSAEAWIETLQADFKKALEGLEACEFLWCWEALVRNAAVSVTEELTGLAVSNSPLDASQFAPDLKLMLRLLAKEQGGPDCTPATAPRHLAAVLAQSVADTLEHSDGLDTLAHHGDWISDGGGLPVQNAFASKLNGVLLTSTAAHAGKAFIPGMVYRVIDQDKFKELFGELPRKLQRACYADLGEGAIWTRGEWEQKTIPVLVEISPVCDFHQGTRRQAMLMAGVIGPAAGGVHGRTGEGHRSLPSIFLRWPSDAFLAQEVFSVFCSRYKVTLLHKQEPEWLVPWFRLRELPTASLRNWHASHSARVGFVSLR